MEYRVLFYETERGRAPAEEIYANMAITIARLRERSGISQNELARMVGTTQQTISRIEDPVIKVLQLILLSK